MRYVFLFCVLIVSGISVNAEVVRHATVTDYLQVVKRQADADGREPNRLISENSPYLLQHAYNRVNWYPWGDEVFEKARKENKPIFLSIGYSTCHWCHVMARESFENKEIAEILNKYFISIKVDREQRPDIDKVYMVATQLINGHGGWPMSVFIDHQQRPFHAATYYPPFTIDDHIGLMDVLIKINNLWKNEPEEIKRIAVAVTARISAAADDSLSSSKLTEKIYQQSFQQIRAVFDEQNGGFGVAPKFPKPGFFSLLNKLAKQKDDKTHASADLATRMMKLTLDRMLAGGIYDQVAGGFHRYSVDESWQVPHFEKMLYSQALMVTTYTDFYEFSPVAEYKKAVYETLYFVQQEMRMISGGYYSALDADSERPDEPGKHAEGAYYLWQQAEIKKLLSKEEFIFLSKYFHIREKGNIFYDPRSEFTGLNILYIDEEFRNEKLTPQQLGWLSSSRKKLNAKRRLRPRPHLDDKIIVAWNGMMISAFARASRVFDETSFLDEAIRSATFINDKLYDKKTEKLFRQYRDGTSDTNANLSDYVWLINAYLEIYDASKDKRWLNWSRKLQSKQDELFMDEASGAYFESAAGDSSLLFRSKSIYDGALPAENSIALSNLRQLAVMVDSEKSKKRYLQQATNLVSSFAQVVNQNPAAASMLLSVEYQ